MTYKIVRLEEPFEIVDGIKTRESVQITILNESGHVEEQRIYGNFDEEALKSYIEYKTLQGDMNDKPIIFKNMYFNHFDIHVFVRLNTCAHDLGNNAEASSNALEAKIEGFIAERCFFDGDSRFDKVVYGLSGFSLAHSRFGDGHVNFQNASFMSQTVHFSGISFGKGEKNFTSTKFYGTSILFFASHFNEGHVNFKCSNFNFGHLNFSGSTFGAGDVDFDFTIFGAHGIDFSGVAFGDGLVSFRNTHFNDGHLLFFGSSFGVGKMTFSDAVFGDGNIDFSYCQFQDTIIHFKYAKMGKGRFNMSHIIHNKGDILFKTVDFKNKLVNFSESKVDTLHFWNALFMEHVNMSLAYCNHLTLENCIIEKTFDMICTSKKNVEIKCLNARDTKNLGQIYLDWPLNDVKGMIYAQKEETNYLDKANQFRMLKENFHGIGHYNDEDYAYVEFKRCQCMSEIYGEDLVHYKSEFKKGMLHSWRLVKFPFRWFVLDFVGNYATNPFRILGTMILTILFFAIMYTMPFVELGGKKEFFVALNHPVLAIYTKGLYHSVVTIFTIGYGDVYPDNFYAMFLSGIEGFLGMFLMSYFTVAFVRKILR